MEALAQAGGVLLFNSVPDPEKRFVVLSKVDNMKFRKPVVPGDQLMLQVNILKLKSKFCHVRGVATVAGEVVVEGEIMASLFYLEERNERG